MPPRCHVAVVSPELWHSRLGHPALAVVTTLHKLSAIQCNKAARVFVTPASLANTLGCPLLVRFPTP
jgi:hypothetical protein